MNEQDHIVIVDDDAEIRSLLEDYLRRNGYEASSASGGRELTRVLERRRADLIVLDVMMPGEDGFDVCRRLRAESSIPIIMLTARGEDTDKIVGLELGADDYLAKPFNPRELLARIKGVLRRARSLPGETAGAPEQGCLEFSGWALNTLSRNLVSPDRVTVPLSGAEYQLLEAFLRHPNRVLSRDHLLNLSRGREAVAFDRSIDMQVSRLRRRLRDHDSSLIQTVRGQGYLLASEVRRTGS
ncbi:MAG: response regulator [Gammaproteobacteria bacterium]|nr:response regulator [Gammaproteobacteria bacterium]